MRTAANLRLVLNHCLPACYESSQLLLAKARFDGTLQLLTSGWERALGYPRQELNRRTLLQLMWSDRRNVAAAVAAILDDLDMASVTVRMRCKDGLAKGFRLHRRYDRYDRTMYILAEETAAETSTVLPFRAERRAARR